MHCLFCYKLAVDSQNKDRFDNVEEEDYENRKREVCNKFYGHIKIREGRRRWLSGVDEEGLNDTICGVCNDCFYLIDTHCKLYEEIECLKLRLRWQLDKCRRIMKYAGKVPSRLQAFQDSFQVDEKTSKVLEDELTNNYNEAMGFRRRIFDACVQRLKVKDPKVQLIQLKRSSNNKIIIDNKDATSREDTNIHVPQPVAEPETSPPPEPEIDDDQESTTTEIEACTNLEVLHIFKSEGEIVSPPESVIETIRSGTIEGTTENHYFYTIVETAQDLAKDSEKPEENDPVMPVAKEHGTFIGIDDLVGIPQNKDTKKSTVENEDESAKLKRKLTSRERESIAENVNKSKTNSGPLAGTINGSTSKTSSKFNIVSNAVNKVLTGLRSIYKCPNCSIDFSNETEFKSHVVTRDCFQKTKKRKCERLMDECNSSDSEDESGDDGLSNISSSSYSDADSDYTPSPKRKRSTHLNTKNRRESEKYKKYEEKQEVKTRCPKENCTKFFLYKDDLERHVVQHGSFDCEFCDYTTDLVRDIVNHEIQHHSHANKAHNRENENSKSPQDNQITCPRCPNKILTINKHQQAEHYMKTHLLRQGGTRNGRTTKV